PPGFHGFTPGHPALLVQFNSKFAPAPGVHSYLVKSLAGSSQLLDEQDQPEGGESNARQPLRAFPDAFANSLPEPDPELGHDKCLNADQDDDHEHRKMQQPDGEADRQLVDADADAQAKHGQPFRAGP